MLPKAIIEHVVNRHVKKDYKLRIASNTVTINGKEALYTDNICSIKFRKDKKLEISCKKYPFTISFEDDSRDFGFDQFFILSKEETIVAPRPVDLIEGVIIDDKIIIEINEIQEHAQEISFDNFYMFSKHEEAEKYFKIYFATFVTDFKIDQNGYASFRINKDYVRVSFDATLSKCLGFKEQMNCYYMGGRLYKGVEKVCLIDRFQQIYIYASCTEPILVGGVQVPLLRKIWIESKYELGDVIHENIDRPMYLSVSDDNINSIEVQVRDDAGRLIAFPYGSKTSLTLHFRKYKQIQSD